MPKEKAAADALHLIICLVITAGVHVIRGVPDRLIRCLFLLPGTKWNTMQVRVVEEISGTAGGGPVLSCDLRNELQNVHICFRTVILWKIH